MDNKLIKSKRISENIFVFKNKSEKCYFNRVDFSREYFDEKDLPSSKKSLKKIPTFKKVKLKKVRIEVTFRCNCQCKYCLVYKNDIAQDIGHMSKETAKSIIKYYKKNIKKGSLMIIGGEPLLNWPVVKMFIESIKDPIKIFTNGTIINNNIISTLKNNKHVRLMISLDGKEVDNKERIATNGKLIYKQVRKNLEKYLKSACKLGISCLINKKTVKKIPDLVKYFHKLGINIIGFSFPHYIKSKSANKKIDINIDEYAKGLIKSFDYIVDNKIYFDQISKRISPFYTKNFRQYACKGIGEEITFYPDGKKTKCTKIDTLQNSNQYGKKYLKQILPINNPYCTECPAIGICGGGCPWDGIMRYNYGVDQRECRLNNKLLEFFIWKLREIEREGRDISFFIK